jgi:hypothetical protein
VQSEQHLIFDDEDSHPIPGRLQHGFLPARKTASRFSL